MGVDEENRVIPDHAIPMRIGNLVNSTSETIVVRKLHFVRVHTMGVVERVRFDDNEHENEGESENKATYELSDGKSEQQLTIRKMFSASFTKEHAHQIRTGDYVEVFGKVRREQETGVIFLNAFSIQKASRSQYEAFQPICAIAESFFESNTPILPTGCKTRAPQHFGLKNNTGELNRFPIGMLEESLSAENNNGVWPRELENIAAELREDEEEVGRKLDEEDSFEAGPLVT
uniref:Uncharacterized protein n=1 Tax=Caenorhabditis japonica TaxID=281687 RepID=A0A8R1HMR5_CAEJA